VSEPREFWIEKFNGVRPSTYKVYTEKPEYINMCKVKIGEGDVIAAVECFQLIEKSAYNELLNELTRVRLLHGHSVADEIRLQAKADKLSAALEDLINSTDLEYFTTSEYDHQQAKQALKEYRE